MRNLNVFKKNKIYWVFVPTGHLTLWKKRKNKNSKKMLLIGKFGLMQWKLKIIIKEEMFLMFLIKLGYIYIYIFIVFFFLYIYIYLLSIFLFFIYIYYFVFFLLLFFCCFYIYIGIYYLFIFIFFICCIFSFFIYSF
jgi:hypothetical protein